jgi:hypothetical protein
MPTLKEQLPDWTDVEEAAYRLARCLGVMGPEIAQMSDAKSIFWSKNEVGDALYRMLTDLVAIGALLEHEQDNSLVKWNPSFKGRWER